MARGYYQPRRKYTKPRKYNGKCEGCGTPKPANETVLLRKAQQMVVIKYHQGAGGVFRLRLRHKKRGMTQTGHPFNF